MKTAAFINVFVRIGLLSFGGPAAQIALMHKELVEDRSWITDAAFTRALSFCMLLPGPEAMQLATYVGWQLRGVWGGLIAGLLFVVPGALCIFALAALYLSYGDLPIVAAVFRGVQATVVVIVFMALLKLSKKAFKTGIEAVLALLAFAALFLFDLPFPLIIAAAAAIGFAIFGSDAASTVPETAPARPLWRTVGLFAALWAAPIVAVWVLDLQFLTDIALFFSQLAIVTFGGAYAVLAYMTQTVVGDYGWLTTGEMVDALGLAETTPGPLILVTQFVAVLAGYAQGSGWMALIAGLLALWVTFIPCFLWIFAFAPFLDKLMQNQRIAGALRGVSASIFGVILNLSVWFSFHVFFGNVQSASLGSLSITLPQWNSIDPIMVGLFCVAAVLLMRVKWSVPAVLGSVGALAAGLAYAL